MNPIFSPYFMICTFCWY